MIKALDVAHFKTQLVKGKPNFVILEIEKQEQFLVLQHFFEEFTKEYDIQLVVFEVYDALNFEEIPIGLTTLKMMYPSANKVIESPEDFILRQHLKKTILLHQTLLL